MTDRFTLDDLRDRKRRGIPLVMATAYDYVTAAAIDDAGIDLALVGDSAAMTILGLPATREVSLDEMLMLTRAVRRGLRRALLIGDLPFGTYETSDEQALTTARQFAAVGCDAVKMEGGGEVVSRVRALGAEGIRVVGHLGLTPQRLKPGETARVEAKSSDAALKLLADAKALEAAGCVAMIFEAVPAAVSDQLVPQIEVPVIGIGAGAALDGQVLVTADLLGLTRGHIPKFVKRYAQLGDAMVDALTRYAADVRDRRFPDAEHTYAMDAAERAALAARLRSHGTNR
jgi:3-methyl-2-oxobutanoate hydroxymethyltransferase